MLLKMILVITVTQLCIRGEISDENKARVPRLQCIAPRKMSGCAGKGYGPVAPQDTYFFLFTNRNRDKAEFLQNCNNSVTENSNFNADNPVVILVFGFFENICNYAAMREMKDKFLIRGDYNVIIVDWAWGNILDFLQNKFIVARQTAQLIENIKEATGAHEDKFHIIGHSVGANLIGLIGRLTKVGRITSLDPAGVSIYDRPEDYHVLKSDAKMVDSIHTDIGRCFPAVGYIYPVGHASFYVNGGRIQLSCYSKAFESLVIGDTVRAITSLISPDLCFQYQAFDYFKVSINPGDCQFTGYECEDYQQAISGACEKKCKDDMSNCAVMGLDWRDKFSDNRSRVYYVETSLSCPYCIKQNN